jgi:hypothetical protein
VPIRFLPRSPDKKRLLDAFVRLKFKSMLTSNRYIELMEMSGTVAKRTIVKRWKFTVAPPHVCAGCYWHRPRADAGRSTTRSCAWSSSRSEHVSRAEEEAKEPAPPPEDEDDITPADPDVLDVVEQIKRSRGE